MNDLMKDILEGRLHPRAPKERMPPEHLAAMRAFHQLHGRWPLRSELETSQATPEPLEAFVDATPPAPLPLPTPDGEIASESVVERPRHIGMAELLGIEKPLREIVTKEYRQGICGRDWMRQTFKDSPGLIAKFDEVDRSEREGG